MPPTLNQLCLNHLSKSSTVYSIWVLSNKTWNLSYLNSTLSADISLKNAWINFQLSRTLWGHSKSTSLVKLHFWIPPCHFFSKAHHPHVIHEKVKLWNNQDEFFRIFDCLSKHVIFKEIDSRGLLLFYNV